MQKVFLKIKKKVDSSYKILIGNNIMKNIAKDIAREKFGNKYVIISDSNTRKFGVRLAGEMKKKKLKVELVSFEAGEKSKNLKVMGLLLKELHKLEMDRKSAIVSVGGGVVGDVAGFCAATYMRGISYVQVPTTLLAMTDSSVGGKVAVDLDSGKNMVGFFYQPKKVYIDVSLLKSLPNKEMVCGLAEVIKSALIRDKSLFGFIEKNVDKILDKDDNVLIETVKRSCKIKSGVVRSDEKESGLRKILNYGHTIGHAIEKLTKYNRFSHGEAVAIGMAVEGLIANKIGKLSGKELKRQNDLFRKIGLPIKIPKINTEKIINELEKDKKAVAGNIEFALVERIGKAIYGVRVQRNIIKEAIGESK